MSHDISEQERAGIVRVLSGLEQAVIEKGFDYVVPENDRGELYYWQSEGDSTPKGCCIVGVAREKLGLTALHDDGSVLDGTGIDSDLTGAEEQYFVIDSPAGKVAALAQTLQDKGCPWGPAFQAASTLATEAFGVFYRADALKHYRLSLFGVEGEK